MQVVRARTLLPRHDRPPIQDAGLVVHDGLVVDLGPFSEIRKTYVGPDIDVDGVLIPGMIDAHSHLRGMPVADHGIEPMPLEPWLCALTTMTALAARDESLVAAGSLLATGVTTVQALLHSFDDVAGYTALVTDVVTSLGAAGIRALLIAGFADRAEFAPEPREDAHSLLPSPVHRMTAAELVQVVAAIESALGSDRDTLVRLGVGPVAAQWSTDDALRLLAEAGAARRVHTHLNESGLQRGWLSGSGTPLERLRSHGLVNDRTSAAHAVDLTESELLVLAAAGASLVHCPTSNGALQVGTAHVGAWLDAGITAALGMDSHDDGTADMFAEMRAALNVSAASGRSLSAREVFAMATTGGAAAVGDTRLGQLVRGGAADAVELSVSLRSGHEVEDIVTLGSPASVRNVWVAGKHVVRDGVTRSNDAEKNARKRMTALLQRDALQRKRRQRNLEPALAQAHALRGNHHDSA